MPDLKNRRIWSESVDYATLRGRHLQASLASRNLELIVGISPRRLSELPDTLASLRDAGVRFSLWPMLDDTSARCLSTKTAERFFEFSLRLVGVCFDRDVVPDALFLDLEPPKRTLGSRRLGKAEKTVSDANTPLRLARLVADMQSMGIFVVASVLPASALPNHDASRLWEEKNGTSIANLPADAINTKALVTRIRAASKGLLSRKDGLAILQTLCRSAKSRFQERAAVSIGCLGQANSRDAKFAYRDPDQLIREISIVNAVGIDDISLSDLSGILHKVSREPWLDAFAYAADTHSRVRPTLRAEAVTRLAGMAVRMQRPR